MWIIFQLINKLVTIYSKLTFIAYHISFFKRKNQAKAREIKILIPIMEKNGKVEPDSASKGTFTFMP